MIPNAINLKGFIGKTIEMDIKLTSQPAITSGAMVKNYGVSLQVVNDKVLLSRIDASTDGVWVPYAEGKAVVGYLNKKNWIASGPFSGCQFAIGEDKKNKKVFSAHIAKQSGSTGEADYKKYRELISYPNGIGIKFPCPI